MGRIISVTDSVTQSSLLFSSLKLCFMSTIHYNPMIHEYIKIDTHNGNKNVTDAKIRSDGRVLYMLLYDFESA